MLGSNKLPRYQYFSLRPQVYSTITAKLPILFNFKYKATGGSGGPKIMLSVSERIHWAVKDADDRIKKYFHSPSYDFLKFAICLLLQYSQKLKIVIPKTALMYLLEKTTHLKVLKLG